MINLYPKDYSGKITTLKHLSDCVEEIDNVDFHRMVDSSIEGAENFADEADKAIKKPSSSAVNEIDGLWKDMQNDVYEDFTDKFNNYIFLVENKIEDIDDFPFREWAEVFSSLKDKPQFDYEEILSNIDKLGELDKDIAAYNISGFLNVIQYDDLKVTGLFPHLNKIINEHFPKAKLIDLVSGVNYSEFVDALNGKSIETKKNSHLFFEYAAYLPIENFAIRQNMSRHLNKIYNLGYNHTENKYSNSLGLDIPLNNLDMNDVYIAFEKTDIWKRIKEDDGFKELFIKNLVKYYQNSINKHHVNNIEPFISHLSKDDVPFAENFFSLLEKYTPSSENFRFENALKIALKCILDKEMPQSDVKVKKAKI